MMSAIDQVLQDNLKFTETFSANETPLKPARKLAVVACMDYRILVEQVLGLKTGDANIIRNAGGIITEDALRSLLVSTHFLGVEEVMIINHTECGMLKFKDEELLARLQQISGTATVSPAHFYAFTDLQENVLKQMQRVKSHPWIPPSLVVRGFIYDVKTGKLVEVPPQK
jgi:carbonic anhydrase